MTVHLLKKYQQFHCHSLKRILIVEDNDINRMLLSDYLSYSGYTVQSLANGSFFFIKIQQFQPDLILLDLKLPDVDGYSLLQQIQQQPAFAKIPVIVVSGFAFKSDQERAVELGACGYFVKPINLNELLRKISEELVIKYM
ncbi:two-component response regulator [Nostoc sp. NIES-3756]|jgi:CheY-like chemotaxis protein|uniref:response regulator n=1 Tax=Nostoc sp. NIES-3756 TaxID=1751286 RepID=UPI000720446F|nr:response regulator [Nostoc sp. NIES-3756]BAT51679.1 two-component response regulator [Nostoc sp. NIES-3756]